MIHQKTGKAIQGIQIHRKPQKNFITKKEAHKNHDSKPKKIHKRLMKKKTTIRFFIFFKGLNLPLKNPIKNHENTKKQQNP